MRNISRTVLYKTILNREECNNTLIPCEEENFNFQLDTIAKSSHTDLVYKCIDCNKKILKRADVVCREYCRCPFCHWKDTREEELHNILYNAVHEIHRRPFRVLKFEDKLDRDGHRCYYDAVIEIRGKKLVFELDSNSHLSDRRTMRNDILKMRHARENNWSVIRIWLPYNAGFNDNIREALRTKIHDFLTRDEDRFEMFMNDHDNLLRNKFLDI